MRQATTMRDHPIRWLLALAVAALTVFAALTVAVTTGPPLGFDSQAFRIGADLRAPWLNSVARAITTLGLIAIVGPAVLLGAALLLRRRHQVRAAALVAGAALAWVAVWIAKLAVGRARPPAPLVHTTGLSFPSGHAANSIGWLALALAVTVAVRTRGGRVTIVVAGALVAVLVGLSRIYLRAHYASDVVAGEALAVAMYALASAGAIAWRARRARSGSEVTAARPSLRSRSAARGQRVR